jgi:hypothetical protein
VSNIVANDTGLASDARFRSVGLLWTNNLAVGDEIVQIFTRPVGGAWSIALSVPVGGSSQSATVSTFLPLTDYEIGLKFVRGSTSAVGYNGDPTTWTAGTAPGSQQVVTTSSAPVNWVSGSFVDAATPIALTWASDQLNVPYLLEKDPGTGFVTVVSDLVATSYPYTIPPAELGTTVTFRVTAQRAAIVGPVAVPDRAVDMFIVVGQPAWVSAVWNSGTGIVALDWTDAANATSYVLEKTLNGGASWLPVATVSPSNYNYAPPVGEYNTTVGFRVTGKNGALSGPVSLTQNVILTIVLAPPVAAGVVWNPSSPRALNNWQLYGSVDVSWAAVPNATSYRVEYNQGAGWFTLGATSGTTLHATINYTQLNLNIDFRVIAKRAGLADSAPSNVVSVTTTYAITVTITNISSGQIVTFVPGAAAEVEFFNAGDLSNYYTSFIDSSPTSSVPGIVGAYAVVIAAPGGTPAKSLPMRHA